jgi:hypothetical protein
MTSESWLPIDSEIPEKDNCSISIASDQLSCIARSGGKSLSNSQEARNLGQAQARAYVEAVALNYSKDDGDLVVECQNSGETPSLLVAVGIEAIKVHETRLYQILAKRPETPPRQNWPGLAAGRSLDAKVKPDTGSSAILDFVGNKFGDDGVC